MAVTTPTEVVGYFKDVYREAGLVDALPTWAPIQDKFAFEEAEALGDTYDFGVSLTKSHSCIYAPSNGGSALTAMAVTAIDVPRAKVESYFIGMRQRIDYRVVLKAKKSGKAAFVQAFGAVLKNLKESHVYRLELTLLYGRDGLGVVDANNSGVLTITDASWATGIWNAGLKNAVLEAFTGVSATETQHNGDLTVTAVDVPNKAITVTGTNAAVVQNDVLYFKGARTTTGYNECLGIYRLLTTTTTYFNINPATYDLWQAQSFAVNGQLSLTSVMDAMALALPYGLEKGLCFVNPNQFADLASDEAALRRYMTAADNRNAKRGSKGIEFQMGQVTVEILIHPMIKADHCMLLPDGEVHRIGASDITEVGGESGLDNGLAGVSFQVADEFSIEMRSVSDQAIYFEVPAKAVLLTAVTYPVSA